MWFVRSQMVPVHDTEGPRRHDGPDLQAHYADQAAQRVPTTMAGTSYVAKIESGPLPTQPVLQQWSQSPMAAWEPKVHDTRLEVHGLRLADERIAQTQARPSLLRV